MGSTEPAELAPKPSSSGNADAAVAASAATNSGEFVNRGELDHPIFVFSIALLTTSASVLCRPADLAG
jgi:hypothetical protein